MAKGFGLNMISKIAGKFHQYVKDGINPTFDLVEKIGDRNPKVGIAIVIGLVAFFPVFTALGQVTRNLRDRE